MVDIVKRGKRKNIIVADGAAWIATQTKELPPDQQTSPGFVLYERQPSYCITVGCSDEHIVRMSESEMLDTVEKWMAAFNERRHKNAA